MGDKLELDLRRTIVALSDTLDVVDDVNTRHGKRVAYMAVECGRHLGFDAQTLDDIFLFGLLHDIGVSSFSERLDLLNNKEPRSLSEHCRRGYKLLRHFSPLRHLAEPILHHHTIWEDFDKLGGATKVAQIANLIHLVDRVDATIFQSSDDDISRNRELALAFLKAQQGAIFQQELVDAFLEVSSSSVFWFRLKQQPLIRFLEDTIEASEPWLIDIGQIKELAKMFAQVVDSRSPFAAEHSQGVSQLASYIGRELALPPLVCEKIEVAGYFHELGKLAEPDEVFGSFSDTDDDQAIDDGYATYEILSQIPGMEDVALWAGFSHGVSGQLGQDFDPEASDCCIPSRILALAEAFQVLVHPLPKREPMSADMAINILEKMAISGRLDTDLVELVKRNPDACLAAATGFGQPAIAGQNGVAA